MKPRRIRKPSPRNLAIYRAVVIEGDSTRDAAREHQLSQTRINQICNSVEKFTSRQSDEELPELSYSERGQHLRRQFKDPEEFQLRLHQILLSISARQGDPIPKLSDGGIRPAFEVGDALDT